MRAWTVFLHNGALAEAHPGLRAGERVRRSLRSPTCVRRTRTCAHTRAPSRRTSRGSAWRRSAPSRSTTTGSSTATPTSATSSRSGRVRAILLGLCFCEHCLAAARSGPAWTERPYAARPPTRSSRAFAGDGSGSRRHPSAGSTSSVREQVVTSLVAEVAEAAETRAPARVSGALGRGQGLRRRPSQGRPCAFDRVAARRRRGHVARACDGIEAIGYAADPERVRRDLDAYGDRRGVGDPPALAPDCDSPANLRAKVDLARERGLRRADFYHYGLMRLDALDWIRDALTP